MRKKIQEAKKHLRQAREWSAKIPSSFKGMSFDEAIKKMRKVREELWEEKLAACS